jgi:poly(beta-D-mannuronate) lyase
LIALVAGCFSVSASEYRVSSAAEIALLAGRVQPGDVLIMTNGVWKDQAVAFNGIGTAERPIILRAETPGQTILTGKSSLLLEGEYVIASGLCFKDGAAGPDGVLIKGRHCRLTETAILGGTWKFFVHLFGRENRVDHCYLADKTSESPTLQVEAEGQPNHHQIDHNHFGPRPPLGRNGGETMRVGYSGQSMSESGTLIEHNLFDRCDGEIEIISSKSCGNSYRFNTFLDCAGMLTLRHGNRCLVEGNFFIGHHKQGSGGIRVIGEGHTIINNYIDSVEKGGFWITSGIPDSPLNGYFQTRSCLIAFNTVIDSSGPCVEVDAGFGTANRSLRPEKITVANNIFSVGRDGSLVKGTERDGYLWLGNLTETDSGHIGIGLVDLALERASDGCWRPKADSPVRGRAQGSFPTVQGDIDGQPRVGGLDVGCDQISDVTPTNRPLNAADVGPSWLNRSASGKTADR